MPRRLRSARPLRRITVATDFSPGARRALRRAAALPLAPGARIEIVHVLPAAQRVIPRVDALLERNRRRQLQKLVRTMSRARSGCRFSGVIARGSAAPEITRVAQRSRSELIVIGRHAQGRILRLFMGSVADRVVRMSPLPVLVVAPTGMRPYRRLLAAVDFHPASRRALDAALRLAHDGPTHLYVVHAVELYRRSVLERAGASPSQIAAYTTEIRKRAKTRLQRLTAGLRCPATPDLCTGEPGAAIEAEIARRRPDLVAVGTRGLHGVSRFILGSVAESVLRRAPGDVLVAGPSGAR